MREEDHFSRAILERFVDGKLPSDEARRAERHLAVCTDCRDKADQVSLLAKLQVLDSWLHPGYDDAFERAAAGAAERLEGLLSESRSTEDLLAELLRETPQVRRFKICHEERFHSLKLCQLLQSRGRENWFLDPAAALELADLAVLVSQHLDAVRYGSGLVEDSRARSLAFLANGFRITSDLWQAERALGQAWVHYIRGGGDLFTEAELLRLTISLRTNQLRFDEASRLSDHTLTIYREVQDRHLEGVTLIQKALILGGEERFSEAIPIVQAGLARIDGDQEPQMLLRGWHNLIGFVSRGGAPEKAKSLLAKKRFLYAELADVFTLARLWWVEGQIAWALGRLVDAEDALRQARDFFLERQFGSEVFSVSLELAEMYAQSGRFRETKNLLGEVIPLGAALGLRRDVFLARLLYEQASRA